MNSAGEGSGLHRIEQAGRADEMPVSSKAPTLRPTGDGSFVFGGWWRALHAEHEVRMARLMAAGDPVVVGSHVEGLLSGCDDVLLRLRTLLADAEDERLTDSFFSHTLRRLMLCTYHWCESLLTRLDTPSGSVDTDLYAKLDDIEKRAALSYAGLTLAPLFASFWTGFARTRAASDPNCLLGKHVEQLHASVAWLNWYLAGDLAVGG